MTRAPHAALALALAVGALGACGRFGFDAERAPPADSAPLAGSDAQMAPPPDAAPRIACDTPTSGSGTVPDAHDQLAITAAPGTLLAASTDDSQVLRVWTFTIGADGSVTPATQGATLDTDSTGTIGAITTPDGVLVTSSYANGTKLYPLHFDGTPRALPTVSSASASTGSLAQSGIDGTLAFVTYGAGGEIDAQLVDSTGTPSGTPQMIIPGALGAGSIVIAPAATGYVVTWTDPSVSPHATELELLGPDLSVVAGPVTANTNPYGSEVGTVAWAPRSQRYLVAWQNKDNMGNDEIQIREYDASLSPLAGADATILTNTGHPRLATDGTSFTLAARGYNPDAVVADDIGADGTVTPEPAPAPNTNALQWATATTSGGQPIVSWLTNGQLWVDSPCAP